MCASSDARRLGIPAIGAVIGHEMSHGFDDRGRRFDDKGNLHPGILMAREFNAEKFMDNRAVRFQNAGQITSNGSPRLSETQCRSPFEGMQPTSHHVPGNHQRHCTPRQPSDSEFVHF